MTLRPFNAQIEDDSRQAGRPAVGARYHLRPEHVAWACRVPFARHFARRLTSLPQLAGRGRHCCPASFSFSNFPPMIVGKSREMVSTAAVSRVARCAPGSSPVERQRRLVRRALPADVTSRLTNSCGAIFSGSRTHIVFQLIEHSLQNLVDPSECQFSRLSYRVSDDPKHSERRDESCSLNRGMGIPQ